MAIIRATIWGLANTVQTVLAGMLATLSLIILQPDNFIKYVGVIILLLMSSWLPALVGGVIFGLNARMGNGWGDLGFGTASYVGISTGLIIATTGGWWFYILFGRGTSGTVVGMLVGMLAYGLVLAVWQLLFLNDATSPSPKLALFYLIVTALQPLAFASIYSALQTSLGNNQCIQLLIPGIVASVPQLCVLSKILSEDSE